MKSLVVIEWDDDDEPGSRFVVEWAAQGPRSTAEEMEQGMRRDGLPIRSVRIVDTQDGFLPVSARGEELAATIPKIVSGSVEEAAKYEGTGTWVCANGHTYEPTYNPSVCHEDGLPLFRSWSAAKEDA